MRRMTLIVLLGVSGFFVDACLAGPHPGDTPASVALSVDSPLFGGWVGTIGKLKVGVCIMPAKSSYFYASHRQGVDLDLFAQSADGGSWFETSPQGNTTTVTGQWSLNAPSGRKLSGTWSDPAGKKTLSIALVRYGTNNACDLLAMLNALGQHPEKIEAGKEQVISGVKYRPLSALDGTVKGIELIDEDGKYKKINKLLRDLLVQAIGDATSCQVDLAEYNGTLSWSYDYGIDLKEVHGGRWLRIGTASDYYCGGAHPNNESSYYVYDMFTGAPLDLGRWVKQGKDGMLPRKLDEMISRQALANRGDSGDDDECRDIYSKDSLYPGYGYALGHAGLIFFKSLPRVVQACGDNVEIPFDTLTPFLTPEGKKGVAVLTGKSRD